MDVDFAGQEAARASPIPLARNALGRELRRLRGPATLEEIVEISASEPVSRAVAPLSAPTLSMAETGVVTPSLETLSALSIVHGISLAQLGRFLVSDLGLPAPRPHGSPDATDLSPGSAEAASRTPWEDIAWNALREGERAVAAGAKVEHLVSIARALHVAGCDAAALAWSRRACLHVESATDPAAAASAHELRATCEIAASEEGRSASPHDLHDAHRCLAAARRLRPPTSEAATLALDVLEARLHAGLGNTLHALGALRRLADRALAACAWRELASARFHLGRLHFRRNQRAAATSCFEGAVSAAEASHDDGLAFEPLFHLLRLVPDAERQRRTALLRRCVHAHARVAIRSRAVREFEEARTLLACAAPGRRQRRRATTS